MYFKNCSVEFFVEKTIIIERDAGEKLVPVLTYVKGLSETKAISAWLSFLSNCHADCAAKIRLDNLLSKDLQLRCTKILDKAIESFISVGSSLSLDKSELSATVHEIIKSMSEKNRAFLSDRFIRICGKKSFDEYWAKFERADSADDISKLVSGPKSSRELIKLAEFCVFFIALAFLYGCGDAFRARMDFLEEKLRVKYGDDFPLDRIGLSLWPLEFSFVQNKIETNENESEHSALLKALRTINPDVKVQARIDTLLWSRDLIAWLDDDYGPYVTFENKDRENRFGQGLLNEGGNIITGKGKEKFVLIAQSAFSDAFAQVDFQHELYMRDIQVYALPDGFIWARNPETKKDMIIDSIHIDAVINIVPSECTTDNRLKIIVDPYYYGLIKNDPEFKRFLSGQEVLESDVVIVDESELYLNLPNFSAVLDPSGQKKLLFNKDKGRTLPHLRLKPGLLVQPEVEITNMASFAGCIRCATNMLPHSYVKDGCSFAITLSEELKTDIKEQIKVLLQENGPAAQRLSKLFVSEICVKILPCKTPWEFDEFTRTAFIYLTPDQATNAEMSREIISKQLDDLTRDVQKRLFSV
jgi:hypothetical protein